MQISQRLNSIKPSQTLAINSRAQEMRAEGLDVISLAAGEPDFSTPRHVKDAAKKAIDENFSRYTPVAGIPELRKAAGEYFGRNYDAPLEPEYIIISAGGKHCLYNLFQALINPGDEVLVPAPYWVSYPDMALLAEGVPVFAQADPKNGFKITPGQLEEKITARTKILVLNSPVNPTGAVYTREELKEIMRWAIGHNLFVISDEIYDQLVYKPARMASAINWLMDFPGNVAVVNGLSKSYAMTGWRVGFAAAATELIKKLAALQGHSASNICSIAQKAAIAALTGPQECVADMRRAFERRRDLAMDIISQWPGVICPRPDGAFYLFIDVSGLYNSRVENSISLCAWLLEDAHVAVVPGAAFGNDSCIRISYAVSDDVLDKGLRRIGESLEKLRRHG